MSDSVNGSSCLVSPFWDGQARDSFSTDFISGTNPSDGRNCLSFAAGSVEDVDAAVASARSAFDSRGWGESAPSERRRVLHRLADLLADNAALLDRFDAEEMGKPISEKLFGASSAAELMRFYAESADKVTGEVFASDRHSLVLNRKVPRGVVAAITPWNFPTFCAALKIAPAIAAGNTVVFKPSENAVRSGQKLVELAVEAGLPPGVLNFVPGRGEIVGKALGLHPDVDMVTFTGSTAVGKLLAQYAAQSNMKFVLAECGGKSPQIVFADSCDLEGVARAIAGNLLTNQGQICSVGSRLLVERSIEREMTDRIQDLFAEAKIGSALHPETTFGPLASRRQLETVLDHIGVAAAQGARLVTGGERALQSSGGFFMQPTMFCDVRPDARISHEEIFGPVLSVTSFTSEAEAVQLANGTRYGLLAYVWTSDLTRAMRMAKGVRSSVLINGAPPQGEGAGFAASSEPFGESGFGAEGGLAGLESYLRRQFIQFNHGVS